jgi:uncharacterized repeat protein (TIGR01451 family)
MNRVYKIALLAMLGIGIAGFARYVWAQSPGQQPPLPTPSALPQNGPPPVSLPGGSPNSQPLSLPGSTPNTPPPVSLPGGPQLPSKGAPGLTVPTPLDLKPIEIPKPIDVMKPLDLSKPVDVPKPIDLPKPLDLTKPVDVPKPAAPLVPMQPDQPMLHTEQPVPMGIEQGVNPNNLTGRQEPAVSLEWIGPPAAKLAQPCDYSLVVRNVCNIGVSQVIVRVRLAEGVTVVGSEPKAIQEGTVLMWEIGNLLPKQERNLQVKLSCANKGDINCQAWVTFTGSTAMTIRVREPKLMIKASAPDRVLVGDACTFMLTVSNPGDHPAEQVKVHANLTEGLEHARGKNVDYDLGSLAPGETRSVQVICGAKSGGEQRCEAVAEAEGGLKATDKAMVNIIMPRLDLEVAGPKLRYLDRKAQYIIRVTNPGDAPATNATVTTMVPPGFKFLTADNGGRHDFSTRTVQWFLGEVGPGQSREVKLEVLAVNVGEHHFKTMAQASRGLKVENDFLTKVEGLSAILLEMVDLEDPIEVGAETVYEIRITNTGSKTETDVKLSCVIPDKMQFKGATGPAKFVQNGSEIVFEAIPKLAPRADAIFRVTCKGITPGVAIFKGRITSTLLVDPVTKEEATRIYAD